MPDTTANFKFDSEDISIASNLDLMDGSVVGDSDAHPEEHHPVDISPCPPSAGSTSGSATKSNTSI